MGDVKNQQDSSFPLKRKKSDLYCQDQDNVANKARKLNPSSNSADSESKYGEINRSYVGNPNSDTDEKTGTDSELENDKNVVAGDTGAEDEQEGGYDGDVEEEAGEEGEYGEEDSQEGGYDGNVEEHAGEEGEDGEEDEQEGGYNGDVEEDAIEEEEEDEDDDDYSIEAKIDEKGKGILIEVDDSDDEDESDMSDDSLAEMHLDNILPSRTRSRSIHPMTVAETTRLMTAATISDA